jgi:hypothetical protein
MIGAVSVEEYAHTVEAGVITNKVRFVPFLVTDRASIHLNLHLGSKKMDFIECFANPIKLEVSELETNKSITRY